MCIDSSTLQSILIPILLQANILKSLSKIDVNNFDEMMSPYLTPLKISNFVVLLSRVFVHISRVRQYLVSNEFMFHGVQSFLEVCEYEDYILIFPIS